MPRSVLSRVPLTLLLAVSACVELTLNRVCRHLLGIPAEGATGLAALIGQVGTFALHLTGLLALAVFTWACVVFIRDRQLLRLPDRLAFTFLAALFLPLSGMALFLPLPQSVAPHLNTGFGLLLLALVVGLLRRPASLRAKIGVTYLAAPLLLQCYFRLSQLLPSLAPSGAHGEIPIMLFQTGEHLMVVGAFAAFLFFAPFPRRANLFAPLPVALAAIITAATALFVRYHYDEAVRAADSGFGLNLPPPSVEMLVPLAAVFFFILTLCTLATHAGTERSTALGLLLVAVSGFHLELSAQFLLTLIGMMLLVRSAIAASPGEERVAGESAPAEAPTCAAWNEYLKRLAVACSRPESSGEAVLLQNHSHQMAHLRGRRDGVPFAVRLLCRAGRVERLEAVMGQPPSDCAPLSLQRTAELRGRRVSQKGAGATVRLQAPDFDERFSLRDATGQAGSLLDDSALRLGMSQMIHGWLGLWPGEGLRYLAQPGKDGWPLPLAEIAFAPEMASTEDLESLMRVLGDLARRARVPEA